MKNKKFIFILFIILILQLFLPSNIILNSYADNSNTNNKSLTLYSKGAVLMETSTGKILYGKNENEKLYPASTTKILTAILAIEKYNLNDKIVANNSAIMAIPSGYSNAAIQPGEALTVKELLELFLIHSANEVGYIFAEDISGNIDNFSKLMNQKATEIGCTNTHFTNPSGIHDAEHYTTAYDMALIAKYCMENKTFRSIVSMPSCTIEPTDKYEKRYFKNTNDLLDSKSKYYYEGAIGIKTGFTTQAKNCLISASQKDNMELITVVLGAEATDDGRSGRYVDTINLFNYGFDNYKIQQIATANKEIKNLVVENATKDSQNLSLVLKDNITALTPSNIDLSNINYSINLNSISAPILQGDVLGKITYKIDDIEYTSDLIANNDVEEAKPFIPIILIAILTIIIFMIIFKFLLHKKKKKNYDSIYRFK